MKSKKKDNTSIAKNTRRLMLEKIDAQLNKLYQEQEALKQQAGAPQPTQQQFPFGGTFLMDLIGGALNQPTKISTAPTPIDTTQLAPTNTDRFSGLPGLTFGQQIGKGLRHMFSTPEARSNTFNTLGTLSPVLYNSFVGLKKPDYLNASDYYNPYEGELRNLMGQGETLMANRRYNINPQLEANRAAQNALNRNITNVSTSTGNLMSNLLGSSAARMRSDAAAYAAKQNADNQYRGQEAQYLANYGNVLGQLGAQKAQTRYGVDVYNQQTLANKRNYLGTATSQLSQYLQNRELMRNQAERDKEQLQILPEIFGGISQYLPFLSQIQTGIK